MKRLLTLVIVSFFIIVGCSSKPKFTEEQMRDANSLWNMANSVCRPANQILIAANVNACYMSAINYYIKKEGPKKEKERAELLFQTGHDKAKKGSSYGRDGDYVLTSIITAFDEYRELQAQLRDNSVGACLELGANWLAMLVSKESYEDGVNKLEKLGTLKSLHEQCIALDFNLEEQPIVQGEKEIDKIVKDFKKKNS